MSARPLVAISIGQIPEQPALGAGPDRLAEVLVLLARQLLRAGCDLAYGGDLRDGGYTGLLLRLLRTESDRAVHCGDRPRRVEDLRRLTSFLAWPGYGDLTADLRARHLDVSAFVCVEPPEVEPHATTAAERAALDPIRRPLALSCMRRAMSLGGVRDVDAREVPAIVACIALGGKVNGYSGFMPGILEEVAWALEAGLGGAPLPVFVLGGFGGGAALLAQGILDRGLPAELTLRRQREVCPGLDGRLAALQRRRCAKLAALYHPRHRYAVLRAACREGVPGLSRRNGLGDADNVVLLKSRDPAAVLSVLAWAPALQG